MKILKGFLSGVCVGICIMGMVDFYNESQDTTPKEVQKGLIRNVAQEYLCKVEKIVDGDTVDVSFKIWNDVTLTKRIRFANFDAWESRGDERDKGKAATLFLIDFLKGNQVYLKTDGSTGKYGRTLGSLLIMKDGVMINVSDKMIEAGHQKISESLP